MWLEKLLARTADRYDVPGAVVAIGHDDQLLEAATGVLNRETGVEATPDSVFQIGSVTKVWTAALVLQLVDEGLVDLDSPVRRYLPGFGVADPAASESVTVRQLLLHTGGFDGDLFEDTGRGDDALDRYVAYLHDHAHQISAPGTRYSYSNSGYTVLGALVARLRGATWESVLRDRLIKPLGVRTMALFAEEAILFRAAAGHFKSQVARPWQLPHSIAPAGATPCAAPRELVRFGRLFLDGGVAGSGDRLLSAGALAAMTEPQLTMPGVAERGGGRRGLGFELFDWGGTAAFGHNGSTMGQAALWRIVPAHRLVVAIGANDDSGPGFFDDLLDAIVGDLTGLTVPARHVPPPGPHTPGPAEFAGRYEFPMAAYDLVVTGDGFDVTTTPLGFAAEWDDEPKTQRYVALSGATYIAAEPENGHHPTFTILEGGRYLYGGRLARRA